MNMQRIGISADASAPVTPETKPAVQKYPEQCLTAIASFLRLRD
jgi:hypothetical protein